MNARKFGIATDYDYRAGHKRDRLTIWEGSFFSSFAGEALSVKDGYMVTTYNGRKFRVSCPSPRNEDNYEEVDAAIDAAMRAAEAEAS